MKWYDIYEEGFVVMEGHVRAHYLGIPDVVDASSGAIGSESGTDALPELACLVSVGKRRYGVNQRTVGTGIASHGRESGAVCSGGLAALASGNQGDARRILR